jgi:hypothetical protein
MKRPICAALVLLVACSSGDECIALPCAPSAPAVTITVTTTTGVNPFPGLTETVTSGPQRSVVCGSGAVCQAVVGPGDCTIRGSAPGFVSQDVKATVTGHDAGCNRCERVDTQRVSVVLAPAA